MEPPIEVQTVGKWNLVRKIPQKGPNRCYVDMLTFYENNEFELVFKTLIANEERVYTYTGEITPKGDANIALGNGIAYLKDFVQNVKISLEDLNYTKEHGYIKGISNIFAKHLND